MDTNSDPNAFLVKTCSLASIATGENANSLLELHNKLLSVDEGCIYYHFWGSHLNPQFFHIHHHNDFASWAYHRLHDPILAEKLNIIDPMEFPNLEILRQEIVEIVENRLEEYEMLTWLKNEESFHFIRSTIVIFESNLRIASPEDLAKFLSIVPPSSIFYHFIDARGRTNEKLDDFSVWLKTFGTKYDILIEELQSIDPFFLSLSQLREKLINVVNFHF